MKKHSVSILSLCFCFALMPSLAFSSSYTLIDIGTLGGDSSSAYGVTYDALNNSIYAVGSSSTAGSSMQQAFLYKYDIGTGASAISNISPISSQSSIAFNISNSGQITGVVGNDQASNPFDSSSYSLLSSSVGGASTAININALGFGINDSGQIAGQVVAGTTEHAFTAVNINGTWSLTDVGSGGTSYAQAINNEGFIVGQDTWSGVLQATLWTNTGEEILLNSAGNGNVYSSIAKGINNNNQIVGYYTDSDNIQHAAWWSKDAQGNWILSEIPTGEGVSSYAFSINDSGLIVGEYHIGDFINAFIYDSITGEFSTLFDLVTDGKLLFDSLESAAYITSELIPDIDNAIVGVGIAADGTEHAFLAYDPDVSNNSPLVTPEPSSMLLMTIGVVGLAFLRKRFKV